MSSTIHGVRCDGTHSLTAVTPFIPVSTAGASRTLAALLIHHPPAGGRTPHGTAASASVSRWSLVSVSGGALSQMERLASTSSTSSTASIDRLAPVMPPSPPSAVASGPGGGSDGKGAAKSSSLTAKPAPGGGPGGRGTAPWSPPPPDAAAFLASSAAFFAAMTWW